MDADARRVGERLSVLKLDMLRPSHMTCGSCKSGVEFLFAHIDTLTDHVIKLEARSLSFDRVEARLHEAERAREDHRLSALSANCNSEGYRKDKEHFRSKWEQAEQRVAALEAALTTLIEAYERECGGGEQCRMHDAARAALSSAPKEESDGR